jgi:glycosyltransferase involved in cell wall biosynthesis
LPSEPPVVVNLASIQERKGTDLFVQTAIKVCQVHPSVEFIWLGDGRPFGTWQTDIERAGLQGRILFPGYVEAAHLILRRASVLFLSSRDDPFPLSVLEAMCLARSIVTFGVGGAPEALAGHGAIVPPFDTNAAAQAILAILDRAPAQRLNLALRERYLALYTPERFAARLDAVIRQHLGERG